jgi:pimeloyl-ACP methyl ester carboxylesterase
VAARSVGGLAIREWGDPAQPGLLLWPGLGSTGAYFAGVPEFLPGRLVAVDPPGFGASPPVDRYRYEQLIELTCAAVSACGCAAIVGHSLGADIALGVANQPPPGLKAAVLIDGGYLDAPTRAELGIPTRSGRAALLDWLQANPLVFADWQSAFREIAQLYGGEVTAALELLVRETFAERDGQVRWRASPETLADLLLAVGREDVAPYARGLAVPTLLIACAQPPEQRRVKEPAWQAFADASPLVELHVAEAWGHNPFHQDPQGAARLIAEWLGPRLGG